MTMIAITAYFYGPPDGPLDKTCHHIFEQHGGEFVGCGTFLLTGERDIEFKIPDKEVPSCRAALKRAGFRLESAGPNSETA
jgi:hypothetical protein